MKKLISGNISYILLVIIYYFVIVSFYGSPLSLYYHEGRYEFLIVPLIFSILLTYPSIKIYRYYRRRKEVVEETLVTETLAACSDSSAIKALVISLRKRARYLRRASWVTLFLTFVSVAFGLYIFTAAGDIAQRDILSHRLSEEILASRYKEREALDQIRAIVDSSIINNKPVLLDEIKRVEDQINDSSRRTEEALNNLVNRSGTNEQLLFFLSTITTRLGSVFLLIFLVQILLSVYRYSIRLVSYYEARADALLLYNGSDAEQLQTLVSTLAAERIEFGKSPSTPIEQAAELLKSAASIKK
ncbi:MAG TPA: hypothetical protein VF656_15210 [Pyrinomonadaceae bacterium]|jgi:hypothetical protein